MAYLKKIELRERVGQALEHSPFYMMVSQLQAPRTLLQALERGWCQDFNEADSKTGMTVLMNLIASGQTTDSLDTHHFGSPGALVEVYNASDLNITILEMIKRGADPWKAALPQVAHQETHYYNQKQSNDKMSIDAFDQAMHAGFTDVVKAALALENAPSVTDISNRRVKGYSRAHSEVIEIPYLHAAVLNNRFDLVDALLAHGLSIEQPDNQGQTPLYYAQSNEALLALIKRKAKLIARDHEGNLPSSKWREVLAPSISNEMIRTLQPLLIQNLGDLPEEEKWPLIRERALEILQKGQKGALVSLVQGAGFKLSDLHFLSQKDPTHKESLLFHASMILLTQPSIAFHGVSLGLQNNQAQHETIPGIPDIFWAWMAVNRANERSGLENIKDETKQKMLEVDPTVYSADKAHLNVKLLQLYTTSGAVKRPHEGLNSLRNMFSDEQKQAIGKLLKPTLSEQQQFGLNADPLVLQFFEGLCKGKAFSVFDFLGFWRYSNEETRREILEYPSFWKTLQYFEKPESYYYYNPMDAIWGLIKEKQIQPPLHTLTSEEIQKVIAAQELANNNQNPENMAYGKSWLERWILTQNTNMANQDVNPPKSKARL